MKSKRILVPLDLMTGTTDPLMFVQNFAAESPVVITLLHVIHLDIVPHERIYEQLKVEAEAALRKLAWLFFGSCDAVRIRVRIGDPSREIVAQAVEEQFDFILLTRAKDRFRILNAGVTRQVLQSAPCPTLVLPGPQAGLRVVPPDPAFSLTPQVAAA